LRRRPRTIIRRQFSRPQRLYLQICGVASEANHDVSRLGSVLCSLRILDVLAFSGACLVPASNTLLCLSTRGTHKAARGAHKSGCTCTHSGNMNREDIMKRPPKTIMSASAKKRAETGDLHLEMGAEAGNWPFTLRSGLKDTVIVRTCVNRQTWSSRTHPGQMVHE
jgi:hypothetical protein